ncbi:MAG: peptide chain release factor N(5)-glutamine methyltransferase [Alphaproteobacteria bacterium]|nr:peptide chain release factor N(5)-glutamine methyltransferase [Alphaproteobacteria bacterium]
MTTARAALKQAIGRLTAAGVPDAARDGRLLLRDALAVDPVRLSLVLDDPMAPEAASRFADLIARRERREPVSRILGRREFWSLPFRISADTLDPRPDTELLVEIALDLLPPDGAARLLDLGTGTGCLLLAILSERPKAEGVGIDINPGAVVVAGGNAAALGLSERATFLAGDWVAPVRGRFDLVLSNPPYIPPSVIAGLDPEVREFDPRLALDGGTDGLAAYRAIAAGLDAVLAGNGTALFEIGYDQAAAVRQIFEERGFSTALRRDLGGRDRCVLVKAGSESACS